MTASTQTLPLAPPALPRPGLLRFFGAVWSALVEARSLQREMLRRYPGIPHE